MLEAQTKTIGRFDYSVHPLTALQGRKALTRLIRVAAPIVAALQAGNMKDALSTLGESLTEADTEYFCDVFSKQTFVIKEGKSIKLDTIFDLHFVQKYSEMCKWLAFCLEVNFGDFLEELSAKSPQDSAPKE